MCQNTKYIHSRSRLPWYSIMVCCVCSLVTPSKKSITELLLNLNSKHHNCHLAKSAPGFTSVVDVTMLARHLKEKSKSWLSYVTSHHNFSSEEKSNVNESINRLKSYCLLSMYNSVTTVFFPFFVPFSFLPAFLSFKKACAVSMS